MEEEQEREKKIGRVDLEWRIWVLGGRGVCFAWLVYLPITIIILFLLAKGNM